MGVLSGEIELLPGDFPTFLYPQGEDDFDPEDMEKNLLRGPLLLAVRTTAIITGI